MSFSYTIGSTITSGTGQRVAAGDQTVSASARNEIEVTLVANSAPNTPVAFNSPKDTIRALVISATKDVVIKVNSSSAPDNTLTLLAGTVYSWIYQAGGPLDALHEKSAGDVDIAALFISRGASVPASTPVTVTIGALYNPS